MASNTQSPMNSDTTSITDEDEFIARELLRKVAEGTSHSQSGSPIHSASSRTGFDDAESPSGVGDGYTNSQSRSDRDIIDAGHTYKVSAPNKAFTFAVTTGMTDSQKWWLAFVFAVLALIVFSPVLFAVTNSVTRGYMPTTSMGGNTWFGVILHSIVFFLLARLILW